MRYPRRLLAEDETVLVLQRPHWRQVCVHALWAMALAALAGGAVAALGHDWVWWVTGGTVGLWTATSARSVARWWASRHVVTTRRVVARRGARRRSTTEVQLAGIVGVRLDRRWWHCLLGHGDLLLDLAGAPGPVRLTGVAGPARVRDEIVRARGGLVPTPPG